MRLSCVTLFIGIALSLPVAAQPPTQTTATPAAPLQLPASAQPPQPAPTPYEPAPLPRSLANCLACPSGTWCQNGICVAAPYPVCPAGFVFDGAGACVPGAYGPPSVDGVSGVDAAEARLQAEREQRRMQTRFTVDFEGALGFMGDGPEPAIGPIGIVWAGIRTHHNPRFGFVVRGGLAVGKPSYRYSQESEATTDSTSLVGPIIEVMPFWGPFGRFFFGPTAWLAYFSFGKSSLTSGTSTSNLGSSVRPGVGFDCGFVLGDQEGVVLSFPVRISAGNGVTVLGSAAIGFQF